MRGSGPAQFGQVGNVDFGKSWEFSKHAGTLAEIPGSVKARTDSRPPVEYCRGGMPILFREAHKA